MTGEDLIERCALPPALEDARVRSLEQLHLLDSPEEERFARITRMARAVFGVPMSSINLLDHHRQWFKQADGLPFGKEMPRDESVCQATIARSYHHPEDPALILDDASTVPGFAELAVVGGDGGIRFYAGYPLYGPGGYAVGTFCIFDTVPRSLDSGQLTAFHELASWAQRELEHSDDLERAATVQRQLLPRPLGDLPGYTVGAMCLPAYAVGGDFYDHYRVKRGVVFTVADVMGKGLGAAIVAASVRAALRGSSLAHDQLGTDTDISDAIESAAAQVSEDLASTETFVTLFHARLDTATGRLTYVDAGHGLVGIIRRDGHAKALKGGGLPLGILPGDSWVSREVTIEPGDTLAIVSDGLLDLFGEGLNVEAAIDFIRKNADPVELCAAVRALAAELPPLDDVTVVAVRRELE